MVWCDVGDDEDKEYREGFCLLDNENVVEQSSRQSALHFEVVYTNIHVCVTCVRYSFVYAFVYVYLLWISQRTCNQNINLTKTKRSHMPCFLYSVIISPVSISLSICNYDIVLSLSLSLSLSLWLSMLILIAIDLYHYSESRNWLCLTYCYNAIRSLQKKHILVIHFGFEQKMCNR